MRVLIINKFLYPNGGSETYIFKLGEALEQHGHEVQYFGMEHEGRCVGNRVNAYTILHRTCIAICPEHCVHSQNGFATSQVYLRLYPSL